MLALKLKLDPTQEQMLVLDKMFWKWASICTRIAKSEDLEEARKSLEPPEGASGIWFSLTQLQQAKGDIADARGALERAAGQKERALERTKRRAADIASMLADESKRDTNPKRKGAFRPKEWIDAGFLKTKHHTVNYWKHEAEKLGKEIERKEKTIVTLKKGKIRAKPTRITLHKNSFLINVGGRKAIIKPFAECDGGQNRLEVKMVTEPEQPKVGSSENSSLYLMEGIKGFVAYSLHRVLFGMNDAEKMLMKAKAPDKVTKKEAKLAKKKEKAESKLKTICEILGRELSDAEKAVIQQENLIFFSDVANYAPSKEYSSMVNAFADEIFVSDRVFNPSKYPILIRKQVRRSKLKKFSNLSPSEWEYYLQLSYEPFSKGQVKTDKFMGIDRGIRHLLAISIFDPASNRFIFNYLEPNPVLDWKWNLRRLKKSIRNRKNAAMVFDGESLHENQMRKQLRSIEGRVEDLYHNISRRIVNLAIANKAEIVLESLEGGGIKQHGRSKGRGMKTLNYALSNFDYGKVAQLIKYKADLEGVPIYDVLAKGTSQNCAKCLLEGKDSRRYVRNGKVGHCPEHYPHGIDADLNAARTIALSRFKGINEPRLFGERNKYRLTRKK